MSDLILPVCYCTAHDDAHVHLPTLVDGQYGLRVQPRCEDDMISLLLLARESIAKRAAHESDPGCVHG